MENQDEKRKVDVEKTYNQILAKREAKLAKEALAEKQATQLTRYFIRARRREQKEIFEHQAELSRRHYERNLQKAKDAGEAAAAVAQMVQEEKVIISAHMAEKGRERQAEELRAKAERAERMKWQQARILYERFQGEERSRLKQEMENQRLEKLQESHRKHEENLKTKQEEKALELQTNQQKRVADAIKVHEQKRKLLKEGQKDAKKIASQVQRRMEEAEVRRQALQQQVQEAKREQFEVVQEKVEMCEKKRQQLRQEKHQMILDKAQEFELRMLLRAQAAEEESESSEEGEASPKKPTDRTKGTRGASKEPGKGAEEPKAQQEKKEEAAPQKDEAPKSPTSPMCYDSPELILANNRAQKDYVRRCASLHQAGADMLTKKQFKALADAAASKEATEDDAYAFRMRSLHQYYIKDGKGKISSPRKSARTPRRKVPTCGLCERPFPLESLVGNASQKMLRRLKEAESSKGKADHKDLLRSNSQTAGAPSSPTSPTAMERPVESLSPPQAEDKVLPGVRLYDAELPLCAACYHRVRICSSHQ